MSWPLGIAYLVASLTFVAGLRLLSSPVTATNGNRVAAAGMTLAVAATFFMQGMHPDNFPFIFVALIAGAVIGVGTSLRVKMTAMPQMVALFNGMGGGAAALGSMLEYVHTSTASAQTLTAGLSTGIGAVSFAGSMIAFAKLQEIMAGNAYRWPWGRYVNAVLLLLMLAVVGVLTAGHPTGSAATLWLVVLVGLALALGLMLVVPIGGADMPVVISLMNSLTGVAVALTGFALENELLIVAGALVGASGTVLTLIMAKAMNRPLGNVLFGGFGAVSAAGVELPPGASVRETSAEDAAILMCYSRRVVIVPGYGLAVAQAQHQVRELSDLLLERRVQVKFAIHPVAGRMPGHMNVLLAEADVPYDQVFEMDAINGEFPSTDVVLVVGANDITNPGARDDPQSAIYGMPILNVDYAQQVVVLKRSMRPGFAGIDNALYYNPKTAMLFGDARTSLQKLVSAVKAVDVPRGSNLPNTGKALQGTST